MEEPAETQWEATAANVVPDILDITVPVFTTYTALFIEKYGVRRPSSCTVDWRVCWILKL